MGIQKWGIFFVAADWQRLFFPVGVGHDKENPVLPSFSSSINVIIVTRFFPALG